MGFHRGDDKRYNSYAGYFKKNFGERLQKLSIDAGFSCPNRDGAKGTSGCTFCNNLAFNPSYCDPDKSITRQIEEGILFHKKRYKRAKRYLAYFQAFSNTHAPIDVLQKKFSEALSHPQVAGLVIGTRPDCIDNEKLGFLKQLSESHYIIVEYGIESCYNHTLKRINRGHTFEETADAIERTSRMGVRTGGHLLFGLPGESVDDMMKEAAIISNLPLNNIKFHQLQILKGTAMEAEYHRDPGDFVQFSMESYVDFIVKFIERLRPSIIIERFAAEVPPRFLVFPAWKLVRYDQISSKVEQRLEELDTWQGKLYIK